MSSTSVATAAMLAIGDELLSGRTKDKNIGQLADVLFLAGIDLKEVRIVGDEEDAIVEALNALRARYTYVFTSGGIGPTHDDITADAISKAFGVPCLHDPLAMQLLGAMYERRGVEFNEARQRMARMPQGAVHIENAVSTAPGFHIGNVYVMAGVPQVFTAMLGTVIPKLEGGVPMLSRSVASPSARAISAVHWRPSRKTIPRPASAPTRVFPKTGSRRKSSFAAARKRQRRPQNVI